MVVSSPALAELTYSDSNANAESLPPSLYRDRDHYLFKQAIRQTDKIISFLRTGDRTELPDYFSLNDPAGDHGLMDKEHLLRISQEPGEQKLGNALLVRSFAAMLYNQVRYSKNSLTQMDQRSLDDYLHIATKIFQDRSGDKHYTDATQARERLASILRQCSFPPDSLHLIAGVGAGEVELSALVDDLGIPPDQIFASDILPLDLLGHSDGPSPTQRLASQIKLHSLTNVLELVRQRRTDLVGKVATITSTGSSLVNHESAILPLEYFFHFSQIQPSGGVFVYESRNYEVDAARNSVIQASLEYTHSRPARPRGSKGVLPAYAREGQTPDTFGAFLHSYALVRTVAHLTGYSFENSNLANPRLALNFFHHPEWFNNAPSPIWSPQEGNYRTFYVMRKTGDPHPMARELINSFYQAFARRFPEDQSLLVSRQV